MFDTRPNEMITLSASAMASIQSLHPKARKQLCRNNLQHNLSYTFYFTDRLITLFGLVLENLKHMIVDKLMNQVPLYEFFRTFPDGEVQSRYTMT